MTLEDKIIAGLKSLPPKPAPEAAQATKKAYSERMSNAIAAVIGAELQKRGCREARPVGAGDVDSGSGAERRMAGGIGAKKVDVTWATEEAGLLMAASIKTVNFRDARSGNYQKNLTNRRGDMLFEAVTLHRRFPYSVLLGLFCLDKEAASDHLKNGVPNPKRRSTFLNAHQRLRLFTGRDDPSGRDEQFERLYLLLLAASPSAAEIQAFRVGDTENPIAMEVILDEILQLVADRNPDFYEFDPPTHRIRRLRR